MIINEPHTDLVEIMMLSHIPVEYSFDADMEANDNILLKTCIITKMRNKMEGGERPGKQNNTTKSVQGLVNDKILCFDQTFSTLSQRCHNKELETLWLLASGKK